MSNWINICEEADLIAGTGVCALHQDEQVAIFKMPLDKSLYAISNYDPFGEANVISRGLIGSLGDTKVVASPLYKQHFCLETGHCLEDESVILKVFNVRLNEGYIQLQAA